MSASATEAVLAWADQVEPQKRWTLFMVAYMSDDTRDGAWSCEASEAQLAHRTGFGVSTVRRHLEALDEDGWLDKLRRYRADGGRDVSRFRLSLEKLDPVGAHRSKWAVGGARNPPVSNLPAPVDGDVDGPGEELGDAVDKGGAPPPVSGGASRQIERGAPLNSGGLIEDIPSFLPSLFKTELLLDAALQIFSVCGEGLADWRESDRVATSLAKLIDRWLDRFDLEADILPVIKDRTSHHRRNPVFNFALFESDIARHRTLRLRFARRTDPEAQP